MPPPSLPIVGTTARAPPTHPPRAPQVASSSSAALASFSSSTSTIRSPYTPRKASQMAITYSPVFDAQECHRNEKQKAEAQKKAHELREKYEVIVHSWQKVCTSSIKSYLSNYSYRMTTSRCMIASKIAMALDSSLLATV
jgi:hypothetical protein